MKSQSTKKRSKKIGHPPGSVTHIGEVHVSKPRVTCFVYSPDTFDEKLLEVNFEQSLAAMMSTGRQIWLNMEGISDVEIIKKLGKVFQIDCLTLEDIGDTTQRTKIEEMKHYVFTLFKAISIDPYTGRPVTEQISMVLGSNFLLTFRERDTPLFDPIIQRLKSSAGRIRNSGLDYLAYTLMDIVVDNYFVVIESVADRTEEIEALVTGQPSRSILESIYLLKKDLLFLRKSIWPLREVGNRMINGDISFINETTKPYLRDVLDHTIHAIDTTETCRDIVTGLMDIYLSSISARMNEVMKLLTVIGTIFMPLSFLAGWYGMNFKYMPELAWKYGYPAIILVTLAIIVSMLVLFRRRKWI